MDIDWAKKELGNILDVGHVDRVYLKAFNNKSLQLPELFYKFQAESCYHA